MLELCRKDKLDKTSCSIVIFLGLLIALCWPVSSKAYTTQLSQDCTRYLHWQSGLEIPYHINKDGCPGLSFDECEAAVNAAFKTVEDIDCAHVTFKYMGTTDAIEHRHSPIDSRDDINLVVWRDDWPPQGVSSDVSVANIWKLTNGKPGEFIEFGFALNSKTYKWATDGSSDAHDVQGVITTQVLYALGLWHSDSEQSILDGRYAYGSIGKRTLLEDDIAGICFLYPEDPEPGYWDTSCPADQHCENSECVEGAPPDAGTSNVVDIIYDSGVDIEKDASSLENSTGSDSATVSSGGQPDIRSEDSGSTEYSSSNTDNNSTHDAFDSGRIAECTFSSECDDGATCIDGQCTQQTTDEQGCNCSVLGKRAEFPLLAFAFIIFLCVGRKLA